MDLPKSSKLHFTYILYGKKVVAFGVNLSFKTHRLAHKYGCRFSAIHSELSAILNFPYPPAKLADCVLVNIRLNKAGHAVMAKPCQRCQQMLQDFHLTQVYYSDKDGHLRKG